MNRLVWKLMRHHLSWAQMLGFFLANLLGMCIVLLGIQFYMDVIPVFSAGDGLVKESYLVVGKKVSAVQTFRGTTPRFSVTEISDLEKQPFVKSLGRFTPAQFDVFASIGSPEMGMGFSTDMFFESLPNEYVDADLSRWRYEPESDSLPLILPRNYLNLYNFGFANTKGLPALSEGVAGLIPIHFQLTGSVARKQMVGRVVAFSDRLNTILVPQSFMDEANRELSPNRTPDVSRIILSLKNPADERIASYLEERGYEDEGDAANTGKMAYLLRVITGVVLGVGLVICGLAFYVLLLSIYLLLQKNTEKIDNLLLIGFKTTHVAAPFYWLSGSLNALVLLISMLVVLAVRSFYLPTISSVFPQLEGGSLWPTLGCGVFLFSLVTLLDYFAIRRSILKIWHIRRG